MTFVSVQELSWMFHVPEAWVRKNFSVIQGNLVLQDEVNVKRSMWTRPAPGCETLHYAPSADTVGVLPFDVTAWIIDSLDRPIADGFVYVLECSEDHPVKIGWALDVEKRRRALQTGSALELKVAGFVCGSRNREARVHDICREARVRGEWFDRRLPSVKAFVHEARVSTIVRSQREARAA